MPAEVAAVVRVLPYNFELRDLKRPEHCSGLFHEKQRCILTEVIKLFFEIKLQSWNHLPVSPPLRVVLEESVL